MTPDLDIPLSAHPVRVCCPEGHTSYHPIDDLPEVCTECHRPLEDDES